MAAAAEGKSAWKSHYVFGSEVIGVNSAYSLLAKTGHIPPSNSKGTEKCRGAHGYSLCTVNIAATPGEDFWATQMVPPQAALLR